MNNKKVFDFIGYRKVLFLIPIVIAVITVIFNCIFGIEMAIEFKGGTMLTYSYTGEIDTNAVKKTVEGENYGAVTVTTGSSMNSSLEVIEISFSSSEGLTADKQTALSDKLQQTFKDNSLTLVNSQDVNPTSGTEFFLKCLVAVLFSFILLVIYIAFRFKKIGGLSAGVFALVALVHDCFMVYAVFVFCRFPIDANFMAVVLTVLGNSINNTIVVYDRIRENRNLYGNSLSLKELVNMSIAQSITLCHINSICKLPVIIKDIGYTSDGLGIQGISTIGYIITEKSIGYILHSFISLSQILISGGRNRILFQPAMASIACLFKVLRIQQRTYILQSKELIIWA